MLPLVRSCDGGSGVGCDGSWRLAMCSGADSWLWRLRSGSLGSGGCALTLGAGSGYALALGADSSSTVRRGDFRSWP